MASLLHAAGRGHIGTRSPTSSIGARSRFQQGTPYVNAASAFRPGSHLQQLSNLNSSLQMTALQG
ncbi:hypothetical protein AJ80_10009 [Polytolypa hystricis UAMH7299]|uniref:Uncharacterized protein n=1 Tax=Polytolypa hystricis (strain UAMH7299) TaxID=1447883 RepID=A0A2B7WEX8_POLH7|nr:hypothetical protein AJ80_10009 [Polytolypa hystricis UAMH7299]